MTRKYFRLFSYCFFLTGSIAIGVSSELQEFPRGEIIEKVVAGEGQSYALYLPKNYNSDKKWPILYCFDPRERGSVPLQLYRAAAEKFGFILAGSNNVRSDDSTAPNLQAVRSVWKDTHERFSLQEGRAYATGFSGGARTACDMGFLYRGSISGVIACGGGFHINHPPSKDTPFLFYGIAGNKDSVYFELRLIEKSLNSFGIANHMEAFNGGHEWPPEEFCAEGLEWMEIRAMKDGKREKDEEVIEQYYKRHLGKADSLETSGRAYDAFSIYHSLLNDLEGLRDTSDAMEKHSRLQVSAAVKNYQLEQEQRDRANAEYSLKIQSIIKAFRATEKGLPNFQKALEYLEISRLKKVVEQKKDTEDGLNAQRLLDAVFVQTSYYLPRSFVEWGDYDRAILCQSISAEIKPEDPWTWYSLARAYALAGKKEKALESLRKAVDFGFNSVERIASENSEFAVLKEESEFKEIVARMKGNAPK